MYANKLCDAGQLPIFRYFESCIYSLKNGQIKSLQADINSLVNRANLRNIFVSPYPTLFNRYGSVGRKIILFYFPNSIPINLIVNSPTLGNNIKFTNNLQLKIFFKYNAVYIGQLFKLANCQQILKK